MSTNRHRIASRALRAALAFAIIPTLLATLASSQARAGRAETYRHRRAEPREQASPHRRHPESHQQVKKRAAVDPCGHRVHSRHPTWCPAPDRILVYKSHPFFLHGAFGIYFGGTLIDIQISSRPPRGYRYIDPICHRSFASVARYRSHLRRHHHAGLLEVVPFDDRIACR